jgi:hypothetical protein
MSFLVKIKAQIYFATKRLNGFITLLKKWIKCFFADTMTAKLRFWEVCCIWTLRSRVCIQGRSWICVRMSVFCCIILRLYEGSRVLVQGFVRNIEVISYQHMSQGQIRMTSYFLTSYVFFPRFSFVVYYFYLLSYKNYHETKQMPFILFLSTKHTLYYVDLLSRIYFGTYVPFPGSGLR